MTSDSPEALAPTRIRQKTVSLVSKALWTQEEDNMLLRFLSTTERANWTELAPHFPGKTAQQISERWSKVVDPSLVKGSWTRPEDEIIIEFAKQFGVKNWTKLAEMLPGRIGKQCRERWRNHLNPANAKGPWTREEDDLLIQLHNQYGNKWVQIGSMMPGRSDNHIKNRWNSTLKKRDPDSSVTYTTPTKRGKRKIETPESIQQMVPPRPNLEFIPKPTDVGASPSLVWTPRMQSPGFGSPMFRESPVLRNSVFSPWQGESDMMMRTPMNDGFPPSPTYQDRPAIIDSMDLE